MSQTLESTETERILAPSELVEQAEALVRNNIRCFWFWHPDARVRYLDDVRQVVHHLREYGDWKAWRKAQNLQRCLLHHSNSAS